MRVRCVSHPVQIRAQSLAVVDDATVSPLLRAVLLPAVCNIREDDDEVWSDMGRVQSSRLEKREEGREKEKKKRWGVPDAS